MTTKCNATIITFDPMKKTNTTVRQPNHLTGMCVCAFTTITLPYLYHSFPLSQLTLRKDSLVGDMILHPCMEARGDFVHNHLGLPGSLVSVELLLFVFMFV